MQKTRITITESTSLSMTQETMERLRVEVMKVKKYKALWYKNGLRIERNARV